MMPPDLHGPPPGERRRLARRGGAPRAPRTRMAVFALVLCACAACSRARACAPAPAQVLFPNIDAIFGLLGAFDSLNPFIVKGIAVQQVRGYVTESLLARGHDEPFTLYGLLGDRVGLYSTPLKPESDFGFRLKFSPSAAARSAHRHSDTASPRARRTASFHPGSRCSSPS